MKKSRLFILVISTLIFTLFLVSCSESTKEGASNNTNIEGTIDKDSNNFTKEESYTNTDKSSSKDYFGTWIVSKNIATTPVYALSEDEIKNYIGKELFLSEQKISFNKENLVNPSFEETVLSDSDFTSETRTSLNIIGVESSTIKKVNVIQNVNSNWSSFFGTSFYVKDSNTLIVLWDGVFFELNKK